MYMKTMDAVREHMLYRPMVPDDRDILFSGKVHTVDDKKDDTQFEAQSTHLTCFLGGMVGMGAKIFNIEHDLAIAEKLTDGCVWAYEIMSTGIMPESMDVIACKSVTNCHWNASLWEQTLDPQFDNREQMIKDYDKNKAMLEAKVEADRLEAEARFAAQEAERKAAEEAELLTQTTAESGSISHGDASDAKRASTTVISVHDEENKANSGTPDSEKSSLRKRLTIAETAEPQRTSHQEKLEKKLNDTKIELAGAAAPGREIEKPSVYVPEVPTPGEIVPDPYRPLNHKDYIASKLEQEGLVPGVVRSHNHYILR
jgi:mannosyl-oligosaccharide alpha-1,2-mannosidase